MVKIIWTEPALEDIHAIMEFIAQDSVYYAEVTVRGIFNAPKRIKKLPLSGRIVPEFFDTTIRETIFGSYLIRHVSSSQLFMRAEILFGI